MSMIGELRTVPAALLPALQGKDKAARVAAMTTVMDSDGVSLDKAWNGLGYLLGNFCTVDPMGGEPVFGVDPGYGPPGLLTPDEVRACARELAAIDERALRKAYDPEEMAADEIYPSIWDRAEERESNLTWLLEVFREVRTFYQDAAQRGDGVLYFLT
jgi:hypothetical protein